MPATNLEVRAAIDAAFAAAQASLHNTVDHLFPAPEVPLLGMNHPDPAKYAKRLMLSSVLSSDGLPTATPPFDMRGPALPQGYDDWGNNSVGNCVEASGEGYVLFASNFGGTLIYPDHNCGLLSYNEVTGWNWSGIGGGTDPFTYFSKWKSNGIPVRTYQPAQIISNFTGHVDAAALNVLVVDNAPSNPIQPGSAVVATGVQGGVTIKGPVIIGNSGAGSYTLSASVSAPIVSEAMSTKFSPHPVSQGRHWIKAYMFGDPANAQLLMDATLAFRGSFLLLAMPTNWRNTAIWDAPPAGHENDPAWKPDSAGGHQVVCVGKTVASPGLPAGWLVKSWSGFKLITDAAMAYIYGTPNPIMPWTTRFVYQWVVALSSTILNEQTLLAPDGLDMPTLDAWIAANGGTASNPALAQIKMAHTLIPKT